jgi:hypothetical protein
VRYGAGQPSEGLSKELRRVLWCVALTGAGYRGLELPLVPFLAGYSKHYQIVHTGAAPQRAHLDLYPRRLPERRPVDLIRTFEERQGSRAPGAPSRRGPMAEQQRSN